MDSNNHQENRMKNTQQNNLKHDNGIRRVDQFINHKKDYFPNLNSKQKFCFYSKNFIQNENNFKKNSNSYNRNNNNGYEHNNKKINVAFDNHKFLQKKKYNDDSITDDYSNSYHLLEGNQFTEKNNFNFSQTNNLNLNEDYDSLHNENNSDLNSNNNFTYNNYLNKQNYKNEDYDYDHSKFHSYKYDNESKNLEKNKEKRSISDKSNDLLIYNSSKSIDNFDFNKKNENRLINSDSIKRENKEIIVNKELNSRHPIKLENSSPMKPGENELSLENKCSNSSLNFWMKKFTTEKEEFENINKRDAYLKGKRQIKNISSYQKIEEIGEGTYGRVCKYK